MKYGVVFFSNLDVSTCYFYLRFGFPSNITETIQSIMYTAKCAGIRKCVCSTVQQTGLHTGVHTYSPSMYTTVYMHIDLSVIQCLYHEHITSDSVFGKAGHHYKNSLRDIFHNYLRKMNFVLRRIHFDVSSEQLFKRLISTVEP